LRKTTFSEKQFCFGADKRVTLPAQCKFLKICLGECPKNRVIKTKIGEPGLNYLFEGYYALLKHSQPYLGFMGNESFFKRTPANVMD